MNHEQSETDRAGQLSTRPVRSSSAPIASVVVGVGLLIVLLWQFGGVADDGKQIQILNPGLHPMWKTAIVGTIGISVACSLVAWIRRQWVMPNAIVNAVANLMSAAVIISLTSVEALFIPAPTLRVGTSFATATEWSELTEPFLLLVAAAAIWDSVDGILRARRRRA
ncbi:hypothetical protein [Brevibacterium linens]|uniref:hypothetical protein n=1 Tax=Brevibacterium linens TaxID=1703 RepID=UPI00351470D4